MNFFRELGGTVLERWRRADFDETSFPDIAATALTARLPSAHVEPFSVMRWVLESHDLGSQADLRATFGQPPVSVYDSEHFYIQVLFWVDGTTAVHQHAFSGAFHVLTGSSIHSTFRFTTNRRYCQSLASGSLELLDVELLTKGDVRPIVAGPTFVHSLFHCERPSVTVVIRTREQPAASPQYEYSRAGLAYDPSARSASGTRKVQMLDLLRTIEHEDFGALARNAAAESDTFLAFQLLRRMAETLPSHKLAALLEGVRPVHEELVDAMTRYADERRREQHIVSMRLGVTNPELRFFLALLLNVPDRGRFIATVRKAFPTRDPSHAVGQWLTALSRLDSIREWATSVSHSSQGGREPQARRASLDHLSIQIVRLLLEGLSDQAVTERLRRDSPDDHEAHASVPTRCAELRRSDLLGALLRA